MSKKLPKLQIVETAKVLLDELHNNLKEMDSLFSSSFKREKLQKRNKEIEIQLLQKVNIFTQMKGA